MLKIISIIAFYLLLSFSFVKAEEHERSSISKYISENKSSKEEVRKFIGTAFKMTLLSSLFCGINLIIFNKFLSNKILNSEEYGYVFVVFGFVIIFYALNNLLLSGFSKTPLYP